jgi:hypothetical protein
MAAVTLCRKSLTSILGRQIQITRCMMIVSSFSVLFDLPVPDTSYLHTKKLDAFVFASGLFSTSLALLKSRDLYHQKSPSDFVLYS